MPIAGPDVDRLVGERALLVRVDTQPRVHALADALLAEVRAGRLEEREFRGSVAAPRLRRQRGWRANGQAGARPGDRGGGGRTTV